MLILLFAINSFGVYLFYWGEIGLCKIRAEQYSDGDYKFSPKVLTVFSSTMKEIRFVNNKEILSKGKLYDIVKTENRQGVTFYYAVGDEEEDYCIQNLRNFQKNSSPENAMEGTSFSIHLEKIFCIEKKAPLSFAALGIFRNRVKTWKDLFFYTTPFDSIVSPPPDHV